MLRNVIISSSKQLNFAKNIIPVMGRNFSSPSSSNETHQKSNDELEKLVKADKVVTFIKGVPEQPMCGFSRAVVQILNIHGVKFTSHNVLENESLRQGMKDFSQWPTFPQVYVGGKFVGGADILYELHKNKELLDVLSAAGIKSQYSESDKPDEKK